MEEEIEAMPPARRIRVRLILLVLLLLVLAGAIFLWLNRLTIADNFVRSELDQREIEASYTIEDIGFRKQVIRDLVIGNPEQPDLTAELVEIGNSFNTGGAGINWVRAKGVRAYGVLRDGKLSLGALDKFSDPDDDSPLALPDIDLVLEQGRMRIDSDYGAIGVALNGAGNLHDGFAGELAAIGAEIVIDNCEISRPSYFGAIEISDRKPKLDGPLRLQKLNCPEFNFSSGALAAALDVELDQHFTSWEGNLGISGGPVRFADYRAEQLRSSIEFAGDLAQLQGSLDLTANQLRSPYASARLGRISGPVELSYGDDPLRVRFSGAPSLTDVRLSSLLRQQIASLPAATADTPIGPLAMRFAEALRRAATDLDMTSDLRIRMDGNNGSLALEALQAEAPNGAMLALSDPLLLSLRGGDVRMLADGSLSIRGGGLPDLSILLNDGSLARGFSGQLIMGAYEAGGANLRIPSLRFFPGARGETYVDGRMILSGPLADGRIEGLQIPVRGNIGAGGRFALFRECATIEFASLRAANLVAGPTATRICPVNGQGIVSNGPSGIQIAANIPNLRLEGALSGSPLSVAGDRLGFDLNDGLLARNIAVRLGSEEELTYLTAEQLRADFGRIITGTLTGADGQIANVPLRLEQIAADWQYTQGTLVADTGLRVRDDKQVERFRPLIVKNATLRIADGRITAEGLLREPTTDRVVASVDIGHQLDSSIGEAVLAVDELRFDDQLQPEMLTPLTLGVIANVQGAIGGIGRINWDAEGDGVQSSGAFRTESINLAAAFGPVTGLSGEIQFSDLLGLETGAGQLVRMGEVNPGVAAFNGQLFYRLLPDYKMEIEGGQWPFAGGMLYLEPTILDLGEEALRKLEFTVVGVDAAQFLKQFEFENLTATGIFDGRLPMIFDQDGGRINGGYLVAREGGGSLAYVGELTYEDMGTFANFAFNALKSLKYQQLTIGMDGAIDGEIITEVKFTGLQQGDDASKNFITRQFAKIPIEFNVKIQAPFMQLLSSAKAFYEPELLVGQNLPALLRAQEEKALEAAKKLKTAPESTVQTRESDDNP